MRSQTEVHRRSPRRDGPVCLPKAVSGLGDGPTPPAGGRHAPEVVYSPPERCLPSAKTAQVRILDFSKTTTTG
jgi:hypothetical protein